MSNLNMSTLCGCANTFTKIKGPKGSKKESLPLGTLSIAHGKVDKRVALTVSPKTFQRDESLFVKKVQYVLGKEKERYSFLEPGASFYGLLRNALGSSSGLIFPYTPTVSFTHQTNYSPVEVLHSNITYNYYKNSPPPSIGLSAKFTADNRDNALHMLSAIWFLVACSKCDFGEKSSNPGLPPPVLYLNGYDSLMDNIPVVITSVRYSYPEQKHYVNLVVDFSKEYRPEPFDWKPGDTTFNDTGFCCIYDERDYVGTGYTINNKLVKYDVENEKGEIVGHGTLEKNTSKGMKYSFWLPTDIQIDISLAVQPNLLKTRKQWTLAGYKSGVLLTHSGKNPLVTIPGRFNQKDLSAITAYSLKNGVQCDTPKSGGQCECLSQLDKMQFIPSGWTW